MDFIKKLGTARLGGGGGILLGEKVKYATDADISEICHVVASA